MRREAHPAQIRDDYRVVLGQPRGQRRPHVAGVAEAVEQDHRRPRAADANVNRDVPDRNVLNAKARREWLNSVGNGGPAQVSIAAATKARKQLPIAIPSTNLTALAGTTCPSLVIRSGTGAPLKRFNSVAKRPCLPPRRSCGRHANSNLSNVHIPGADYQERAIFDLKAKRAVGIDAVERPGDAFIGAGMHG